jgi:hypothetical protein
MSCRTTRRLEVAGQLVVHLVDRLELLPDAADGVVEGYVDSVVLVAGELAPREDAVARDDSAVSLGLDDRELLTGRISASEPNVNAGQNVVLSPSISVTR